MSRIALVVARAANSVIGADGKLPWRIPEDMRRFKAITLGKPCIMGRKTWDSLPRKPLPERANIVVTRNREFHAEGAVIVHSLDDALEWARRETPPEIMVIGGADIYKAALACAERIYLTDVDDEFAGDASFTFERKSWREIDRVEQTTPDGLRYAFVTLERF